MTKYGRSPWTDRSPRSRVPSYPRLKGSHQFDVVIIGGGLTGCATAYAFAAAGIKVALVEEGQIGRGVSAFSSGWISDDPGASFAAAEQLLGRRAARHAWQSWRRAARDFTALVRRLDVKCQLEARETLIVATTPEQAVQLTREQRGRKAAGLDAPSVNAKGVFAEVAVNASSAIRTRDGATIDPYRAAIGLAAAAAGRGAQIFERTAARRTKFGRRTADVVLEDGTHPDEPDRRRDRPANGALQVADQALLAEKLVPRADGADPGKGAASARAPRRRRSRPGRAASRRAMG